MKKCLNRLHRQPNRSSGVRAIPAANRAGTETGGKVRLVQTRTAAEIAVAARRVPADGNYFETDFSACCSCTFLLQGIPFVMFSKRWEKIPISWEFS